MHPVERDQDLANDDRAAVRGAEQLGDIGALPATGFDGTGFICDPGLVGRRLLPDCSQR
jgi:hypothetical protein